jgi:hypothetical protein
MRNQGDQFVGAVCIHGSISYQEQTFFSQFSYCHSKLTSRVSLRGTNE